MTFPPASNGARCGAESPLSAGRRNGAAHEVELAPVSELLANAGAELRGLCAAAYQVEAAVGALIETRGALGSEGLRGLQELDRLIQHIDGLADYLGALAEASGDLGEVDAGAARRLVKVARLADGLAGRRVAPGPADDLGDGVEFL
ncbi:MAG: hypothetical protein ACFCUS_15505 [Rubrimonas sp.]|uniref:hypothetical protein n=1 Tax=Rubrimonas sp. TaxID=2036015 RepID=UPI002FDC9E4A